MPVPPEKTRKIFIGNSSNKIKAGVPKIIWAYWDGPPSPSGEACQNSWRNYANGYEIILLNKKSLHEYIPYFPAIPSGTPVQLISDLIRLTLLEKYGGIWMDYSIILNKPIEEILIPLENNHGDIFAFYNEHLGEYKKNHARPIVENGFIAARPGESFIKKWREYHQDCILSDNWKDYYKNFSNYRDLVSNFLTHDQDLIDYLACYVSAQRAMISLSDSRLVLVNAEDDYYFCRYSIKSNLRSIRLAHLLLLAPVHSKKSIPGLVKLTRGNRLFIDEYIKYKCFVPGSMLGRYIEK